VQYPRRVEPGREGEDLPPLTVGERSAIAITLPFVTVTKNHMKNNRLKEESITVTSGQFEATTAKVLLPRSEMKSR
jgi:hypothetical protein